MTRRLMPDPRTAVIPLAVGVASLLVTHAPQPAVGVHLSGPDDHTHREYQTEMARDLRGLANGCSTGIILTGHGAPLTGLRITRL
jgi:hypothetical protein